MDSGSRSRASFRSIALRIAVFDVQAALITLALWLGLGLVHAGVLAAAMVLRIPLWMLALHRATEPLRRWEQTPAAQRSDALLQETDACLQQILRRYVWTFVLISTGSLLIPVLSTLLHLPSGAPRLGPSETLALVTLPLTVIVPGAPYYRAVLERILAPWLDAISGELFRRRLETQRPSLTMGRQLASFVIAQLVSLLLIVAAVVICLRAQEVRAHAAAEQRRRAELSALHLRHGEAGLDDVRVEPRARLEPALAHVLEQADAGSLYLPERGLVVAVAGVDEARVAIAEAEPEEDVRALALVLLLGLPLLSAMVWSTCADYIRHLLEPLEGLAAAAHEFATRGELHELARIAPVRNDEVGRLADGVNAMFDALQDLAHAAELVAGGELDLEFEHPGALNEAFRSMVARLSTLVAKMRETSLSLAAAATQLLTLTEHQERAADQQSRSVEEVGASITTLADAAAEIAQATAEVVRDVEQSAAMGRAVSDEIAQLRERTAEVGELLTKIHAIAERSDLLALNGSLEAVRAGEVGRGFALVAAQMRRLAENIAGILADAGRQLGKIERAGTSTQDRASEGRQIVSRAAAQARSIAEVTGRQHEQSRHAARGMEAVGSASAEAAALTDQVRGAAEGLRREAQHLDRLLASWIADSPSSSSAGQ